MDIMARLRGAFHALSGKIVGAGGFLSDYMGRAKSGIHVNADNALNFTAVYACVRIISESIGALPLHLYRRTAEGKAVARGHPLHRLLYLEPNPYMDSTVFRETMLSNVLLWGNAYAEIEFNRHGQVIALWPVPPRNVVVKKNVKNAIFYEVTADDGAVYNLEYFRMLHIMGYSSNGLVGRSTISLLGEAIGLGLAAEEFGARFFGNGAHMSGFMEHPGNMSDAAYNRMKDEIKEKYQGLGKSHRIMFLESGLTFKPNSIPPKESQMLETRKFQVEEIARFFRVPLHMLQSLDRATNNNIEHQGMDFVTHCLTPWIVRFETAINRKLLFGTEQDEYFYKLNLAALLRGDLKSRYDSYVALYREAKREESNY